MIESIISSNLEKAIIDTIEQQCLRYREHVKREKSLFYAPYTKTRKKHALTAAVLSGFAPGRFCLKEVQTQDLSYGLQNNALVQPELYTETAVIQIYSNSATPLDNTVVQKRCKEYNGEAHSEKRFLLVIFTADKHGYLKKIDIKYPNENCQIVESKNIYTNEIALNHTRAG